MSNDHKATSSDSTGTAEICNGMTRTLGTQSPRAKPPGPSRMLRRRRRAAAHRYHTAPQLSAARAAQTGPALRASVPACHAACSRPCTGNTGWSTKHCCREGRLCKLLCIGALPCHGWPLAGKPVCTGARVAPVSQHAVLKLTRHCSWARWPGRRWRWRPRTARGDRRMQGGMHQICCTAATSDHSAALKGACKSGLVHAMHTQPARHVPTARAARPLSPVWLLLRIRLSGLLAVAPPLTFLVAGSTCMYQCLHRIHWLAQLHWAQLGSVVVQGTAAALAATHCASGSGSQ